MKKLAAVLVLLAGCDLYFGGGDDDPPPPCYAGGYGEDGLVANELRNPNTGECESFGGGYPCDGTCGPCPATTEPGGSGALPNWPQCYSQCEVLDEQSCLVASGCQAAYESKEGYMDPAGGGQAFLGCWATTNYPIEPVPNCAAYDANTCAQFDACSINYVAQIQPDDGIQRYFTHCSAEGGSGDFCYSDAECAPDERCTAGYEECNPAPGCEDGQACPAVCAGHCVPRNGNSCAAVDCGPGWNCEEQCSAGPNGEMVCNPVCVQDASCALIDCVEGYHCVETCTDTPPDPNMPNPGCGQCYPTCVPDNQPTSCEEVTDEMACHARGDCTPVYQGEDCTCYPDGCTCNELTFERCQSGTSGGGGGGTPGDPRT